MTQPLDKYIARLTTLLDQAGDDVETVLSVGNELVRAVQVNESIEQSRKKPSWNMPYTTWNGGATPV